MKRLLIFIIFAFTLFSFTPSVFAQNQKTNVSATVGDFTLSISGFVTPFASVVVKTKDGVLLASLTTNEQGNLSVFDILINKGLSGLCFTVIDQKRLGESETCIPMSEPESNIVMQDIFLPPTLVLSQTEINENAQVGASGYTMPLAQVTISVGQKQIVTTADQKGFFTASLGAIKAGQYNIYAIALYNGKTSYTPTKFLGLQSQSLTSQIQKKIISLPWGWIVFAAVICILIIIVIVVLSRPSLSQKVGKRVKEYIRVLQEKVMDLIHGTA